MKIKKMTRRIFVFVSVLAALIVVFFKKNSKGLSETCHETAGDLKNNIGVSPDGKSYVYEAKNGSPEDNTRKVIEMMGGITKVIGHDDIVLLKPNAQWWSQGTTNTNSMKAFIEMVLEIPGFSGEVIIGENHHFPEDDSRGWTTGERNGDFNLNELVAHFQGMGRRNVTKSHWHDGGPSEPNMHGGAGNGGIVKGPEEGDGYVWRNDLVYTAPSGRKAMMSYPVFTSEYSGITIDFCKGPWKGGKYLDRKLKFINFSALNHHENTAVTASIKNYLGILDMTCGYRGKEPEGYYNSHIVANNTLNWRVKEILKKFGWKEYLPAIGGCAGYFMKNIRIADLNIITAEWVGYASRTDSNFSFHAKTVLASADPVALDYMAVRDVLLPVTHDNTKNQELIDLHDPDLKDSPFRQFIYMCHRMGIGNLNEDNIVKIQSG